MSCLRFMGNTRRSGDWSNFKWLKPRASKSKIRRLELMAKSDLAAERCAAAGNPMTPREVLCVLYLDPNRSVRGWVARNPECPPEILRALAFDDPDPSVRAFAKWKLEK